MSTISNSNSNIELNTQRLKAPRTGSLRTRSPRTTSSSDRNESANTNNRLINLEEQINELSIKVEKELKKINDGLQPAHQNTKSTDTSPNRSPPGDGSLRGGSKSKKSAPKKKKVDTKKRVRKSPSKGRKRS